MEIYSVVVVLEEGPKPRAFLYPADFRGILCKTGEDEFWSFKLNGEVNRKILFNEPIETSLSFLVGDRPTSFKEDSEFLIYDGKSQIGLGRFVK